MSHGFRLGAACTMTNAGDDAHFDNSDRSVLSWFNYSAAKYACASLENWYFWQNNSVEKTYIDCEILVNNKKNNPQKTEMHRLVAMHLRVVNLCLYISTLLTKSQ